jgi:hypothetical protein
MRPPATALAIFSFAVCAIAPPSWRRVRSFFHDRTSDVDFDHSAKVRDLQARLTAFMDAHVYPNERRFEDEAGQGNRWEPLPLVEELKARARAEGLWNLFLPES